MTKLFPSAINKKIILTIASSLGLLVILSSIYAGFHTYRAVRAVQAQDLTAAVRHAQAAQPISHLTATLTFHQVPMVEFWQAGLTAIIDAEQLLQTTSAYTEQMLGNSDQHDDQVLKFKAELNHLAKQTEKLSSSSERSWLIKKFVSPSQLQQIKDVQQLLTTLPQLLSGQHTYLIIFQNSEELRATGGFMGSYALLKLDEGQLSELKIQDIYVPAGQVEGLVTAPPGVKEYLSEDDQLHLPDANWAADFPSSAQQVMSYLAFGQETALDGLIAINLEVVEAMLTILGPIKISDYQATVTAQNFSDIARAERAEFFPGSQQKRHFLSRFFNQLTYAISQSNETQKQTLITAFLTELKMKNVLVFSQEPQLQTLFEKTNIAGNLNLAVPTDRYLYLVESNVGINKANREVDRAVTLELNPETTLIEVSFTNRHLPPEPANLTEPAAADHLTYVNYQRLILRPDDEVTELKVNNQLLSSWDEEILTTAAGEKFKQIGFLVTVPEKSSSNFSVKLAHPLKPGTSAADSTKAPATDSTSPTLPSPTLYLQKQPGLKPTLYTINRHGEQKSVMLEKDLFI